MRPDRLGRRHPDFSSDGSTANGSKVVIGSTINALAIAIIVATVIYFVVVVPGSRLMQRRKAGLEREVEAPPEDIGLL